MKLESNGLQSHGEKSRNIDINFFHKMYGKSESIELKHYLTEIMIAYFFIKPLHGSLFRKLKDTIMGQTRYPTMERIIGSN